MIIFDLDGTLADCEHRRHFVDPEKNYNFARWNGNDFKGFKDGQFNLDKNWEPDWKSFHEACDKDEPIEPVIEIWNQQISLGMMNFHGIWSGRCESVRDKTEKWLEKHLLCFNPKQLKMRPIGDSTPDDELKEKWLDEYISLKNDESNIYRKYSGQKALSLENQQKEFREKGDIDFVFDDRPKVVRMWRRRGIFVFNCAQHDEEF